MGSKDDIMAEITISAACTAAHNLNLHIHGVFY